MSYSKAHQNFSTHLQKPEALTNPEDFLGPNYQTVLNFWTFMDSLTEDNWNEVARRYDALDPDSRDAAGSAARYAAVSAARYAAGSAAGAATHELMGMQTLLNDGKTLMFVPLFDFTKEETKEEPLIKIRLTTGEIFNARIVRSPVVFPSTPTMSGINPWFSEYNHTFNE